MNSYGTRLTCEIPSPLIYHSGGPCPSMWGLRNLRPNITFMETITFTWQILLFWNFWVLNDCWSWAIHNISWILKPPLLPCQPFRPECANTAVVDLINNTNMTSTMHIRQHLSTPYQKKFACQLSVTGIENITEAEEELSEATATSRDRKNLVINVTKIFPVAT